MKILVLTKRQYTGKDLIDDAYGRLFHLPEELALLGHEILGICLSYRVKPERAYNFNQFTRRSINLGKLFPIGLIKYIHKVNLEIQSFKPDVIWACSDAIHAIAGHYFAQKHEIPCVIDLYDNFESFKATSIPGIRPHFRKSVSQCSGVTIVSRSLRDLVKKNHPAQANITVIENGIPSNHFYPEDKLSCRRALNLPKQGQLIGTTGAISKSRGIGALLQAFENLSTTNKSLFLVLSGPIDEDIQLPENPNVIYLGNLPYETVPKVINSLDIAVICNLSSSFGSFCFPQKFYEIIACKTPVIAARTGDLAHILRSYDNNLYDPLDPNSLTKKLLKNLHSPSIVDIQVHTWPLLAKKLESFLLETVSRK